MKNLLETLDSSQCGMFKLCRQTNLISLLEIELIFIFQTVYLFKALSECNIATLSTYIPRCLFLESVHNIYLFVAVDIYKQPISLLIHQLVIRLTLCRISQSAIHSINRFCESIKDFKTNQTSQEVKARIHFQILLYVLLIVIHVKVFAEFTFKFQ